MNIIRARSATLIIIVSMLFGCSTAQNSIATGNENVAGKHALIVYVSRPNNTKAIAEIIHSGV